MRLPVRVGRRQQIGQRAIAEIETCPLDRRVDDGQEIDAFLAQSRLELRHRGDVPPAIRTMEAAENADQDRCPATIIVDRDLARPGDRVEYDVRGGIAGLERAILERRSHGGSLLVLVEERKHDERAEIQSVLVAKRPCQFEMPLGLLHVVEVEVESGQTIIAGKQELRLPGLARNLERLM